MKIIGLFSFFILVNGQSDDYVATWNSAHLQCAERGGLFVNHGVSLETLRGVISTTPIWLGGRRVHTSWAWADGQPLYKAQGCFKRPPNLDLQYDNITEVFDCFLSCKSVYKYGVISGDRCTCIDYIGNLSRADDGRCKEPCARNFGETCGGSGFVSVYQRSSVDFPFYSELSNTDLSDCGYLSEDRSELVIKTDSCGDVNTFKRAFCKDPGGLVAPRAEYKTWEESCRGSTKAHVTRADNPHLNDPKYYWIGLNRTTIWTWDDGSSADPEVGSIVYGEKQGGCLAAYEDEAKKIYLITRPCSSKLRVVCLHGIPPHISTSTAQPITSLKEKTETYRRTTKEPFTSKSTTITPSTTPPSSRGTTTSLPPSTTLKIATLELTTTKTTTTLKPTSPTTSSTKAPTTTCETTTLSTTTPTTTLPTTTTTSSTNKPTTTYMPTNPTTTGQTPSTSPTTQTTSTKLPTTTTTTEPSTMTSKPLTTTMRITTTLPTTQTTTLKESKTLTIFSTPTTQSNLGHGNTQSVTSYVDKTSQRLTSTLHPFIWYTDKSLGTNSAESTVSAGFPPSTSVASSSTSKLTGQRLQVTSPVNDPGIPPNGLYIGLGVAGGVVLLILIAIILAAISRTRGGQSKIYRVLLRSRRSLSQHSNSSTASKENLVDKSFWGKTAKRVKLQSVTTDDRIIKWRDDNWGFEMEDGDDSVFSEPPSPVQNGQVASVGVTTRASLAGPDPLRSVHFEDELEKRRSQILNGNGD